MSTPPAANYISNAARTEAEIKAAFESWLAAMKEQPGGSAHTTLTISGGSITPTTSYHLVDTEGAAATDNLTNAAVTNHPDGRILILQSANSARDVVVKHAAGGSGQFSLAGSADLTLTDTSMRLMLRLNGTQWEEIIRWYGGDKTSHRAFYDLPTLTTGPNSFTKRQEWAQGANVASAAALSLGTGGNYFIVTGTTTITSIGSMQAGTIVVLHFNNILTVTHNATSLILQGAQSLTTQDGDVLIMLSLGSGNWKEIGRSLANPTTSFDPEQFMEFYEDFETFNNVDITDGIAAKYRWANKVGIGGLAQIAGSGGVLSFRRSAASNNYVVPYGQNAQPPFLASKNPTLKIRCANFTSGGTLINYIGLMSALITAGVPANGIYFRTTAPSGGNWIGVCRSGGAESTVDTGVGATSGTYFQLKIVVRGGGTAADVYVDNVLKGTISANIPSAALFFCAGETNFDGAGQGFDIDSVFVRQAR